MHLEFTKTAQGRRWAAKVALVAMGCSAALGVGIAAPIGAQDPAAPATGAPASTSATEQTVAPGQRDAVTNEPAPVKDTAKSDERLLNLIIIGLLVLAAVIALATLLFWKSTAPEEQEEPEAADGERPVNPGQDPPVEPGIDLGLLEAPLPVESSPAPAGEAPAPAPLRRVMASFPSSPMGDVAHVSPPEPVDQRPSAPVAPGDSSDGDISTLGAGASPGRPSVAPPDAVRPSPQRAGAYRIPAPDELPPQPDRPFADAETRPPVQRAEPQTPTVPRRVSPPDQPVGDSAIVTTSRPIPGVPVAGGDHADDDEPPVVVRRRRRDRPAGPWGEGAGGGHRPDVPPLPPPDPQDQGYQRGVRVVRPGEPEGADVDEQ